MVSADNIEKRVADFSAHCRRLGLKATRQRTAIYRELAGSREHPSAETLYRQVRRKIPSISFDTVYRTLRTLAKAGLVKHVGAVKERMRYDANLAGHHHFVCTACGRVVDVFSKALDRVPVPRDVVLPGRVDALHIELRGTCGNCRN